MIPGNVVEYLDGKELALAFCLTGETKGKLGVLTATGRKESLAAKKVMFVFSSPLAPTAIREDVLGLLTKYQAQREERAQTLSLVELWELILDEGDERDWTLKELAELLFEEGAGDFEKAVALRSLLAQRTHFWRKADNFRVRTQEQVEEALTRLEVEAQREVQREVLKQWMHAIWNRESFHVEERFAGYVDEWRAKIRDSAIHGERSSHHSHVQRLLKELDNKSLDSAFLFMVRLGEWTPDQNVDLLVNETLLEFPEEVLAAAREVEKTFKTHLADPDREDLTHWPCHSIDDPETTEVDDAVGFRETEDGFQVVIHIADAAALLDPEVSVLEAEIRERATSVYLPDLKIRMVPESLSDGVLSLLQGVERLAFSFVVDLDPRGKLIKSRMTPSKILVTERLDYDQVDQFVAQGETYWTSFAAVAELLKAGREKKGALNIPFPRMDVRLDGDTVTLVADERDSIAQTIVSEMAILANRVAADYLAVHQLPAIYRGQRAPEPPIEHRDVWLPQHLFDIRKSFSRSSMGLEPCPHSGLGLDQYVQATSPIRRYRDLAHQRQIKHHLLTGEALYTVEQMEEILTRTSTPVSQAEKMERRRKGYFLHKYLKTQRGTELEAVVLSSSAERYVLQLTHSLREIEVPHGPAGLKAPGDLVKVKLLSVYPRDRVIKVSSPL